MIFYDGSTGSVGQSFAAALAAHQRDGAALVARLEDDAAFADELERHGARGWRDRVQAKGAAAIGDDSVVHFVQLAARVPVPLCEADEAGAHHINVTQVVARVTRFVAWARAKRLTPRVLYVSTGHVYAATKPGTRLDEAATLAPRSAYARSKLAAETALRGIQQREGFPLLIVRLFGLVAPAQPAAYMLQGILSRARARNMSQIPGLSFVRDLLDARDVCATLIRLCTSRSSGLPDDGLLNLCSGKPTRLRDVVVEVVQQMYPESSTSLLSELTEAPGRADDVPWIVGDPRRIELLLGSPVQRISLAQTVRDAIAAQDAVG